MLESFQSLEGGLIGVIILFQMYLAADLLRKINLYKSLFLQKTLPTVIQKDVPIDILEQGDLDEAILYSSEYLEGEDSEQETESIAYLHPGKTNKPVLNTIIKYINIYLIKNRANGADFHLISDIVNKHIENERNKIENRLPGPLYIGLAGTMLGIIFGLNSVDFSVSTLEQVTSAGGDSLSSIEPLIKGVQVAMTASLIGLLITTIFSVFLFKSAQSAAEDGRSEFLSFLQAELMPRMSKGILPEITTLSKKLDRFSRNTVKAINSLDVIVQNSVSSVQIEAKILADIQKLDLDRMSHANIMLLNQLNGMMDSFKNFASYYNELNTSMQQTSTLVDHLNKLVQNGQKLEEGLGLLIQGVDDSRQATQFFNKHIRSFKEYDSAIITAVGNTDISMKNAVNQLSDSVKAQALHFQNSVSTYDSKLRDAFNESINKFSDTMKALSSESLDAIQKGVPKFNQLDKLNELQGFKESINQLTASGKGLHETLERNQATQLDILKKIASIPSHESLKPALIENQKEAKSTNRNIIGTVDLILKWTAYISVICIGLYFLLSYFKIL